MNYVVDVCVDSRKLRPGVAFCRRATGSPTAVSLNLIVVPTPQGKHPAPISDQSMDSWRLSRRLVRTASRISMVSSTCVSSLSKTSLTNVIPIWILTETVHQRGDVEATPASECGRFPWVRLRFSSLFPCIPLDVQWEPVRLHARAPRC